MNKNFIKKIKMDIVNYLNSKMSQIKETGMNKEFFRKIKMDSINYFNSKTSQIKKLKLFCKSKKICSKLSTKWNSNKFKFSGIMLIVAFIVFTSFQGVDYYKEYAKRAEELRIEKELEEKRLQFKEEVAKILSKSTSENQLAYKNFEKELKKAEKVFNNAVRNKQAFINKLTSFSMCKNICWMEIKDSIYKTSNAKRKVKSLTNSYITRHCNKSMKIVMAAYAKYCNEIKHNNTNFNVNLCELSNSQEFNDIMTKDIVLAFQKDIDVINQDLDNIITKTNGATLGISSSIIATIIGRTIGRVASRFIAKTVAISWLPAIDGPLPFGDIAFGVIETGFLAWDGYELYKAQVVLKRDVTKKLTSSLSQTKKKLFNRSRNTALNILEKANQANQSKIKSLIG